MRRCRNRKNGIQNNKETGAIGCILSRRFLLLFVFPVPDKDTAKKTVDKYKVGVCFLNGTLERRGIATEKGNINREIAADNKLLKEIKARITRLYNWSKEQSAQSQGRESIKDFLFQAKQDTAPTSRYAKVKALQADAKLFNFLMENGIKSMILSI